MGVNRPLGVLVLRTVHTSIHCSLSDPLCKNRQGTLGAHIVRSHMFSITLDILHFTVILDL